MQFREKLHRFALNTSVSRTVGPVKVEADGSVQSTWNWKRLSRCVGKSGGKSTSMKKLGEPAGGAGPSRSEGSIPPKGEATSKSTIRASGSPTSILSRSKATAPWPAKLKEG